MNEYEWDERKRQENAEKHEIDFNCDSQFRLGQLPCIRSNDYAR